MIAEMAYIERENMYERCGRSHTLLSSFSFFVSFWWMNLRLTAIEERKQSTKDVWELEKEKWTEKETERERERKSINDIATDKMAEHVR